ncbi:MAG: hypothetical protein PHD43_23125 [Methylococcales bacterium]|nr:hypothetical protein [Methylococcales bacterium]
MIEQRYYFYRPAIDGHFTDNGISVIELLRTYPALVWRRDWTTMRLLWALRASHAEFEDHTNGIMVTSTMRYGGDGEEKVNGLVLRASDTVLTHPERWYYYKLNVHDDSHKSAVDVLVDLVDHNQGYDKWYIAKFMTGPRGRKLIEWLTKRNLNDPEKFICSGITCLAANTTIGEEFENYGVYRTLLIELEKLMKQFNNDEPDPLSSSLAFYRSGLTPYSQVDDKPLLRRNG